MSGQTTQQHSLHVWTNHTTTQLTCLDKPHNNTAYMSGQTTQQHSLHVWTNHTTTQLTYLDKPHNTTEAALSPAVAATGLLKTCCF